MTSKAGHCLESKKERKKMAVVVCVHILMLFSDPGFQLGQCIKVVALPGRKDCLTCIPCNVCFLDDWLVIL